MSDSGEQTIPDIIISRSSIPDVERARNIRMMPVLEDQDEEGETDSSKESGADDERDTEQEMQAASVSKTEMIKSKMDADDNTPLLADSSGILGKDHEQLQTLSLSSTEAGPSLSVFPFPNIEEFVSEYEDAVEDEQMLLATGQVTEQTRQFKVDVAADFEHLESSPDNEDTTSKLCKNCYNLRSNVMCPTAFQLKSSSRVLPRGLL